MLRPRPEAPQREVRSSLPTKTTSVCTSGRTPGKTQAVHQDGGACVLEIRGLKSPGLKSPLGSAMLVRLECIKLVNLKTKTMLICPWDYVCDLSERGEGPVS